MKSKKKLKASKNSKKWLRNRNYKLSNKFKKKINLPNKQVFLNNKNFKIQNFPKALICKKLVP